MRPKHADTRSTLSFLDGRDGPIALEAFSDLIAPLSPEAFESEYWGRQPFFIKRNRRAHFDDVLSLSDIDAMLSSMVFYPGEVRVAKDGVVVPQSRIVRHQVIDRDAVWALYEDGATVVFEHLNRKHPPLLRLMSACETRFRVPFRANAYLTPAGSRGFDLHYDTHDVLVLQVSGSKTWQVHDDPLPLPHEASTFAPKWAARSERLAEVTLEPGDVLYLPRGYIHGASANEDTSFHITIGIRSVTLRDAYQTALKRVLLSRPEFRRVVRFADISRACPQARAILLDALAEVDLRTALRDADLSFMRKRTRPFEGRLLDAVAGVEIDMQTRLRLAHGALCRVTRGEANAVLSYDRESLTLPLGAAPALERVASRAPFQPADLPGLEQESRLLLARKLHACRLLDVVTEDA